MPNLDKFLLFGLPDSAKQALYEGVLAVAVSDQLRGYHNSALGDINGSALTKSEEAELRDARNRLKRPEVGYQFSTVDELVKIILRHVVGNRLSR